MTFFIKRWWRRLTFKPTGRCRSCGGPCAPGKKWCWQQGEDESNRAFLERMDIPVSPYPRERAHTRERAYTRGQRNEDVEICFHAFGALVAIVFFVALLAWVAYELVKEAL